MGEGVIIPWPMLYLVAENMHQVHPLPSAPPSTVKGVRLVQESTGSFPLAPSSAEGPRHSMAVCRAPIRNRA